MFNRQPGRGAERGISYDAHIGMRSVPLRVRLRLLFGGFNNVIGWFFFGLGMLFVWVFGGTSILYDVAFFSGELVTTQAKIKAVTQTSLSINEKRVYEYQYNYVVADQTYSGKTDGFGGQYQWGDLTTIEYVIRDPARSRIRGMTASIGQYVIYLTLIFPLVGLGLIFFGFRKGWKGIRLLSTGKEATGKSISSKATNTRINNRTVYQYTFAFNAQNGDSYQVTGKSHLSERFDGESDQRQKGNNGADGEIVEPLVYNPANPADAVLLDDLPGSPRIRSDGSVSVDDSLEKFGLIIPFIAIFANLLWVVHVLEFF